MESLTEEQKVRILQNKKRALEIQSNLKQTNASELGNANVLINVSEIKQRPLVCLQVVSSQKFQDNNDFDLCLNLSNSHSLGENLSTVCTNTLQSENEIFMFTSFNEQCCKSCQIRLRPEFETICKSTVSSEYLLPEVYFILSLSHYSNSVSLFKNAHICFKGTIKTMMCYEKVNPKNPSWRPMNMYLRKHAIVKAIEKFGSLNQLENEKQRRGDVKLIKDLETVSSVFSCKQNQVHELNAEDNGSIISPHKRSKPGSKTKSVFRGLADKVLSMKK